MAFEGVAPFKIDRTTSGKDVMSHDPASYSQHFTKPDHWEASLSHRRKALDHAREKRGKHLVDHHESMYQYHFERSKV